VTATNERKVNFTAECFFFIVIPPLGAPLAVFLTKGQNHGLNFGCAAVNYLDATGEQD
jgi:hypothetical protein